MGMFDTVYVSVDVAAALQIRCRRCAPHDSDASWQTKSLESCMCSYFLRHDDVGTVRLYLLDPPRGRRYWRAWTEEEIAESDRAAERGDRFALWRKKAGEGCFLPEAYLPQNRRQRFMGELPHQWVEICRQCECGEWAEHWIKFCDGVATEVRSEPPRVEPGSIEDSGDPDFF